MSKPLFQLFLISLFVGFSDQVSLAQSNFETVNKSTHKSSKVHKSDINLSLTALANENQFSNATVFELNANYFLNYTVNPYIFFELNPTAQLQSGQVQSIDANEKLENRLGLLQAEVFFQWMEKSHFALGILNAGQIYSPLLASEKGYFSTQIKQSIIKRPWRFSLQSQVSIPNSESMVTDQNEKESTPLLVSAGVSSSWELSENSYTHLTLNYFKYSQIPTTISTESIKAGNTGDDNKISETERTFKYAYQGLDAHIKFNRWLTRAFYLIGQGSYVYNEKAPDGLNKGQAFGGGGGFNLTSNYSLEFQGSFFRIEPDAVMAQYGNPQYFRTNHQGFDYGTSLFFKKENFKISLYVNDAKLIYQNTNQSDERVYFLKFEVLNVVI